MRKGKGEERAGWEGKGRKQGWVKEMWKERDGENGQEGNWKAWGKTDYWQQG
jgi:hypothetical protein